ncbi:MAG: NADH:flavin oxidoreductase/NADH oxidase [Planctomycetes bacterium]|nr:NADH:flavin oxidoreductase/NADH oxidase [Planctomycetota bacterium]
MDSQKQSCHLFSPLKLRSLTLANRCVVAPMCQYSAVDGCAQPWHAVHIGMLATGGWGIVILEATGVEPRGRITPDCLGLWGDAQEEALAKTLATVRAAVPGACLGIQLAHAGRKASTYGPMVGKKGLIPRDQGGWEPFGASPTAFGALAVPHEMTHDEMRSCRDAFVAATTRAARLKFDLVEVHAAHGYLLASFLSPLSNKRTDNYGGSLANRMRYPLEVVTAMRAAWPAEKPLGVRYGATDLTDDGWQVADACAFGRALKEIGADILHISIAGNSTAPWKSSPGWLADYAGEIRKATALPVIAVGELEDPLLAEKLLVEGKADAIALARGALREPRWPWIAARALGAKPPCPPQCEWCVGQSARA